MAAKKKSSSSKRKNINLALQGGGAHGAFSWGVLDELLRDDRLHIEAVTGTSAGAINAVVLAYGIIIGGKEGARALLKEFWGKVSAAASLVPLRPTLIDKMLGTMNMDYSPGFMAMDYLTRTFSPYQLNLFDINPLRTILEETVDFEAIRRNKIIKIFVNATNVRNGKIHVFNTEEMTIDMVMASCCLPFIFKAVEVNGESYWDGGYSGNPALFPLFYKAECSDIVIVQVNPIHVADVPTHASEILDRVNEISFNSALMGEVRAIEFVKKLLNQGKLSENTYKEVRLHMIEAEAIMATLGSASKFNADWEFLTHLRDTGTQAAADWLEAHYDKVGVKSSLDVEAMFL